MVLKSLHRMRIISHTCEYFSKWCHHLLFLADGSFSLDGSAIAPLSAFVKGREGFSGSNCTPKGSVEEEIYKSQIMCLEVVTQCHHSK